ncbi:MAG: hypothetical protein FWB96_06885 [Defluviitaleaceae bacterium]|nr:hypothetical protein [Defluviitaleaceae bacterium]MCL2262580.1 hypothetical protein [Defluviitaleaceae bacterium]
MVINSLNVAQSQVRPLTKEVILNCPRGIAGNNPDRTRTLPATIQLTPDGMRHLEISRALAGAASDIRDEGLSSGDMVQDLSMAFGRIYEQFSPAGNSPVSAERRFTAGENFTRDEVIFYDNRHWEILQDFTHNGDQNWRPGLAHSLFRETEGESPSRGYCPILHRVFHGATRMAFGVEATREFMHLGSRYEFENCENTNVLIRNTVLTLQPEAQAAWLQSQENANVFAEAFLQNVYTQGHEAAFNLAMARIN